MAIRVSIYLKTGQYVGCFESTCPPGIGDAIVAQPWQGGVAITYTVVSRSWNVERYQPADPTMCRVTGVRVEVK